MSFKELLKIINFCSLIRLAVYIAGLTLDLNIFII